MTFLESDLVYVHWVEGIVFFCLSWTGAKCVTGCAGPVADLAHVDAYIGVEGAGGYGERVPLLARDGGDVDEEPLAGFVAHGGFGELEFYRVIGVADDFHDFGLLAGADLADDALDQIEASAEEFPAPAFVADAVGPEDVAGEGRIVYDRVADEAIGCVRVHAK